VRFGRCCNPVPGDDIIGFITRGRGVTVHTRACDKTLTLDPLRRVDVSWDTRAADVKRPVSIRVVTDDRPGVLAQISKTISEAGMNISQATCRTTGLGRAVNTFEMAIGELKQLRSVMHDIEAIDGVVSVERVYSSEKVSS
jgi:GTP diphosphokinase / guanosine-3',5'-bis(diphosphate) 3'-diphosphatase